MFVTRISLSKDDCTRHRIISDYDIHRFVYSLFMKSADSENRDFLYKADLRYGQLSIVVRSERVPNYAEEIKYEIKELKEEFLENERYAFSLRIAPIIQSDSGKEVALRTESGAIEWLLKREELLGICLSRETIYRSGSGVIRAKQVGLQYADLSGVMTVTDREKFKKAFRNGIGRHKAFGFGMLQIIPLK